MEKGYGSILNPNMLAGYCWTVVRKTPTEECKRRKTTK
jgi:hypothetical protein